MGAFIPLSAKSTMLIVRDEDGKYQSHPECLSDIGSRFQSGLSIEVCTFLSALRFSGISEYQIRKGTRLSNQQLHTACKRHGVVWSISPEQRLDDMRDFAFELQAQVQQAGEEIGRLDTDLAHARELYGGTLAKLSFLRDELARRSSLQVSCLGAILRLG
jgi:hypothetical protein